MKHYKWIRWNGEVMVALFNADGGHRNEFSLMGNDGIFSLEANGMVYGPGPAGDNTKHGPAEIVGEITPPHGKLDTDEPLIVTARSLVVTDHSTNKEYWFDYQTIWNSGDDNPYWFIKGVGSQMCRITMDDFNEALFTVSQYMNQGAEQVAWIVHFLRAHCTAPVIDD